MSKTHVLFILDRSGSMERLAADVRGGYNAWLDQAIKDGADFAITLTTFNTSVQQLAAGAAPADAPRLDDHNFVAQGGTALLDAVGNTIRTFQQAVTLGPEDKVLVHVETDGQENSSVEFDHAAIASVVADRQGAGWAFVFAGIGLTDWADAQRSGLGGQRVNSAASSAGTSARFAGSYAVTRSYAGGQTVAADFAEELQAEVDKREGEATP